MASKKQSFVVDNMPAGAIPKYDCGATATPIVCKIVVKKKGSTETVESKMVKVKKDDTSYRYTVPLYKIDENTLQGVANQIISMKFHKTNMFDVVLCIRGDEIGLAKHDCGGS